MQHGANNTSNSTKQKTSQLSLRLGLETLTDREREILRCLAEGTRNKELAQKLTISPRTVQKHLQRIYAKLGVDGRTAAAIVAVRSLAQTE